MAETTYVQGKFKSNSHTMMRYSIYIQDYTAGATSVELRFSMYGGRCDVSGYTAWSTYAWASAKTYDKTSKQNKSGKMTESNYSSYSLGSIYIDVGIDPATGKTTQAVTAGVSWDSDTYGERSVSTTVIASGTQLVEPSVYTVSYNKNGGSSTPSSHTNCAYGSQITLRAGITRANGTASTLTQTYNGNNGTASKQTSTSTATPTYSFNGWKSNYNNSTYAASAKMYVYADTTMTAQWSSSTSYSSTTAATATRANGSDTSGYKFTFNANGGSCDITTSDGTRTITYTMNGWYTATSGGTLVAASGASFTPTKTQTLYAQWSSSASTNAVTMPTATRTGYTFLGWATSSSATTADYTAGQSITPSKNTTLYAVWKPAGCIYIYTAYME